MRDRRLRGVVTAGAVAVLSAAALALTSAPAASAAPSAPSGSADRPGFAPADRATIRPGTMTHTNGAQCTANFVFSDGSHVYLGQAAHCSGTGDSSETDGCTSGSLDIGTPVEVEGASKPGRLAYSSWIAMHEAGETDPDTCAYNDFALVELDPADVASTNPTLPFYGGPNGVAENGTRAGDVVFGYGNSELRGGLAALRPKTGTSLGTSGSGRTHTVLTLPPGIPGDSGSGYTTADGNALGVLSTLNIAPQTGTNGVSDLKHDLDYANASGDLDDEVSLVPGDVPFTPRPVPVGVGG